MGIPLFNYGEDVFIRGVFAIREARWLHMVPMVCLSNENVSKRAPKK